MKINLPAFLLVVSLTAACSKNSDNSQTCNVTYTDDSPLSSNEPVWYYSTVTGNATVTSISYQDSAGTTVVNNPTLPWSKSVNLPQGSTATITANGTANTGGEINISALAEGQTGGTNCP